MVELSAGSCGEEICVFTMALPVFASPILSDKSLRMGIAERFSLDLLIEKAARNLAHGQHSVGSGVA